ncbi:hypothetical protein HK096_011615, partial [Nowakowskiella sp. JEL0078]
AVLTFGGLDVKSSESQQGDLGQTKETQVGFFKQLRLPRSLSFSNQESRCQIFPPPLGTCGLVRVASAGKKSMVQTTLLNSFILFALATYATFVSSALIEISDFGDNPTNLQMHVWLPKNKSLAKPPILLAMHGCGSSGPKFALKNNGDISELADEYGFIVIFPSGSQKIYDIICFDSWSSDSKVRSGQTDHVGLVSMVRHTVDRYGGDESKIYSLGESSGGMQTNTLLVLYPDIFKAGVVFMGVPFGCFESEADVIIIPRVGNCTAGRVIKSPQQWGDIARNGFPGYAGTYPRVQIWHGREDFLVDYKCLKQEVLQWTNLLGYSLIPFRRDSIHFGWIREIYGKSDSADLETVTVKGAGHSLPKAGMCKFAIKFLGLDGTRPQSVPKT